MKLINSKNNKSLIFSNTQSPCAIILINLKGTCLYLLIGFNVYLDPLVQMDSATSISTVLLVDVEVGSFSSYISVPTPWAKHTKTIVRGAPSLGNLSCSKSDCLLLSQSPSPPRCPARSSSSSCNKSSPPLRSCCYHGCVVAIQEAKG